jgi:hypothetical protein
LPVNIAKPALGATHPNTFTPGMAGQEYLAEGTPKAAKPAGACLHHSGSLGVSGDDDPD